MVSRFSRDGQGSGFYRHFRGVPFGLLPARRIPSLGATGGAREVSLEPSLATEKLVVRRPNPPRCTPHRTDLALSSGISPQMLQDTDEAIVWFCKAADQGHDPIPALHRTGSKP